MLFYFPTIRGSQLIQYLCNECGHDLKSFKRLTDEQYQEFMNAFNDRDKNPKTTNESEE
ncbi:hypothetical protein J2T17_005003 [Paenibacillus mucilaginosus]